MGVLEYPYTPAKRTFLVVYWNQLVCLCVHVSVYVRNTSFCQSCGEGIKSHSVTALVVFTLSGFPGEAWQCYYALVVPGQNWHGPHQGCTSHIYTGEKVPAGNVC